MLSGLGIDDIAERVYRSLLECPSVPPGDLARTLGVTEPRIGEALTLLGELGLVRKGTGNRPVHPAIALTPLVSKARAALVAERHKVELAEAGIAELATLVPPPGSGDTEDTAGITVNRGTAAAWACLEHVVATARSEVRVLAASGPAPGVDDPDDYAAILDLAVRLASRGVDLRLILLDSVRLVPRIVEGAHRMLTEGVRLRTIATLPAWLFLVDDEYVVTALDPADGTRGSVTQRTRGAVALASELFARTWREATPFGEASPSGIELSGAQRRLLAMIVNGSKDDTIARQFSVSTRTVRRMITELYDVAGVSGRIPLAFRAAQRGWLSESELDRL
ncbi:DNA-binding response regulator [Saccharomonospora sp. NPDC006951]